MAGAAQFGAGARQNGAPPGRRAPKERILEYPPFFPVPPSRQTRARVLIAPSQLARRFHGLLGRAVGDNIASIRSDDSFCRENQKKPTSQMSPSLEKLIQAVPGVVFQFRMTPDGTRSFPYLSVGVRELYECSPEDVYADVSLMTEAVLAEDQEPLWRSVNRTKEEFTPWIHEYRIRTLSGKVKWIRGQAQPERQDDGSVLWSGIFVDISEIKATESRLRRLQELYAAVTEANRLISGAQHQDDLFYGICKIAVELGGMKMAWIGAPNASTRRLSPMTKYGAGIEILEDDSFFARLDAIEDRGQAATAFSENRTLVNQDFLRNARTKQWQDLGCKYGFGSSASFPIRDNQRPIAVLTVYRHEINGFDEESVALLERLSSDISLAVTALSGIVERKRLEEALRFRQFGLDHVDEEILWIDQNARICEANDTACRVLGYSRSELLQLTVPDIDLDMNAERWRAHWQGLRQKKILHFESRQKNRDGQTCPTEVVANHFEYQGVEYSCTLIRNITERKIMEEALAESQERFNLFMDTLPVATFIKDTDDRMLYANRYMTDVLGARSWLGKSTRDIFPPELAEKMVADDQRALDAGNLVIEQQIPTTDGRTRTYQTHKFRIRQSNRPPLLGGIALDITERKQMEEKIWNLAYFDSLTNLPNRRMLLDRLDQSLSRAKRHQHSLAVIFLDLDYFKTINDSLGHDVGDLLLKEVSARLTGCVRMEDTVSRLGGDEFVILLSEITHSEDAALVAEKILKAIAVPIEIAGNTLNISASIGIAVYRMNSQDDMHALLKQADAAMYAAKYAGRNGYRFHGE